MAQDEDDVRAAIARTNRRFEEAMSAGDPARAARDAYTADARALPPDMPIVRGREALEQFWVAAAAQLGVARLQLSTLELEVHGAVAHEIGTATLTLKDGNEVGAKFCVVWKQDGDEWRWHIDTWNMGV